MKPMLLPIVLGAVLGGLFVLGARAWTRGRERRTLALGLVVAAVIYVGFALAAGGNGGDLILETTGVAIFGALAWLGLRHSLWWLPTGWLAHVAWDVGLHVYHQHGLVPAWYPLLCVGFDLVVVGYLLGVGRPRAIEAYKVLIPVILAVLGCSSKPAPATSPAPTSSAAPSCAVGDTVLVRETLYFGRNRPGGGTVSDAEWRAFLAEVVTPRFPLGLTVQEATGQWKGANGSVEQEQSEIVTVFHPGDIAATRAVHDIALEYKRRFQQEAVLRERTPTCARFE
jgi:hypothetical protein